MYRVEFGVVYQYINVLTCFSKLVITAPTKKHVHFGFYVKEKKKN